MRDRLLQLADEARREASAAHRAHRDESLRLNRDGRAVLAALGEAATRLQRISEQLERLATESAPRT